MIGKRRIQYEDELSQDGRNYDVWFDYVRLEEEALHSLRADDATTEEEEAAIGRVREVYASKHYGAVNLLKVTRLI